MEIGLGTVQFGMEYGIVDHHHGKTPPHEIKDILDFAQHNSIRLIDTASLYGDSERAIGNVLQSKDHFKIVTKTPKFHGNVITKSHQEKLVQAFDQSLNLLGQSSLYGLLMHHANDLSKANAEKIFDKMFELKTQGKVQKIGVSVYAEDDIETIYNRFDFDLIQLPLNIFDQRLLENGCIQWLKSKNVEIHVRSIFLKGLLLMELFEISDYFLPVMDKIIYYRESIADAAISPLSAAFHFIKSITEIDVAICGIHTLEQFKEIMLMSMKEPLYSLNYQDYAININQFVNPALWKL